MFLIVYIINNYLTFIITIKESSNHTFGCFCRPDLFNYSEGALVYCTTKLKRGGGSYIICFLICVVLHVILLHSDKRQFTPRGEAFLLFICLPTNKIDHPQKAGPQIIKTLHYLYTITNKDISSHLLQLA